MPSPVRGAGLLAGSLVFSLAGFHLAAAATATNEPDEFNTVEAERSAQLKPDEDVPGLRVNLQDRERPQSTSLIALSTSDAALLMTYCVELDRPIDPDAPGMEEVPWDQHPKPESPFHQNRDQINWILHHSFPAVDRAVIEDKVDHDFQGGLSREEAIAGTQAAVWSFSDDVALDREDPIRTSRRHSADDVLALYDYLTGEENVGLGDQPTPELALTPGALSGESGSMIGPFTVSTTADDVQVSANLPETVELVDGDGQALGDVVADGAQLHVDVPEGIEDGDGSVHLSASAMLSLGRLFIAADYENRPTQSLILASSENTELEVTGEVSWVTSEEPTPTGTPTPTPTETPSPTDSPTPTQTPTDTPSPTATSTPSESPTPTDTPEPTSPPEDDEDDDELPDTGVATGPLLAVGAVATAAGLMLLSRRSRA